MLLGGLAGENFELSFAESHKLADLCGLAAVMRLVAPLDSAEGAALKLGVAADAEAQLAGLVGEAWPTVCEPVPEERAAAVVEVAPMVTTTLESPRVRQDGAARPASAVDRSRQRRLRAAMATLIPGVLLFAPMIGVLAYRRQGEREVRDLRDGAAGREWTDAEYARGLTLNQRYRSTTTAAAVLGATGAALVVTGIVLAATGGRRAQVAVAPWGGRRAAGISLEGRF